MLVIVKVFQQIYIKLKEYLRSKENPKRDEYIQALKAADNGNYLSLIEMHKITY